MDDVIVPVIYFEGNESELTDVFQRINEGGKPLTKYEIFALSWSDYKVSNFKDREMLEILRNRYEKLVENIEELNFDFEISHIEEIDIFEYYFILSKHVGEELGYGSGDDSIDTIGFGVINACLRNKNNLIY